MSRNHRPELPRALGLLDLILLKLVAIVNVTLVPAVAVHGRTTRMLWVLAFLAFLVPETIAVLRLARLYPGEGGVYLWARKQFGEAHGFISGWCYWTNNLFYIPTLLVYTAGLLAFTGWQSEALLESKWFVAAVAFGLLTVITAANIRGLLIGKWIQNVGAGGTMATAVLMTVGAIVANVKGVAAVGTTSAPVGWEVAASFSVMCFAFVGIELASTMGDEIQAPEANLRRAVFIAGGLSLALYMLLTETLLQLVPVQELGVIQGIMQAVTNGAARAGLPWLVAPIAVMQAISIAGIASAWFAGSARVPFVAGLDNALPAALGRVHPRWRSPHVALITGGVLSAALMAMSLFGSTVAEAYQVLLKAAVVVQLVPFLYLFLGLCRLSESRLIDRVAGVIGLLTTAAGILAAFVPPADVQRAVVFEAKLIVGVLGPIAAGWMMFRRSILRARSA